MTFTYTLTCTLDNTAALPPVAGSEEQRAYWVTPTILAWPLSLLPRGMDREVVVTDAGDPLPGSGLALRLITAPDGGAAGPAAAWNRRAASLSPPRGALAR